MPPGALLELWFFADWGWEWLEDRNAEPTVTGTCVWIRATYSDTPWEVWRTPQLLGLGPRSWDHLNPSRLSEGPVRTSWELQDLTYWR